MVNNSANSSVLLRSSSWLSSWLPLLLVYHYFLVLFHPTAMVLPAASVAALQITPLLSTCIDACQRGCVEIRKVQAARQRGEQEGERAFKVTLKEASDPRSALTEADTAAHRAIVGSLRREWGRDHLVIIGEEDEHEEEEDDDLLQEDEVWEPLKRDLLSDIEDVMIMYTDDEGVPCATDIDASHDIRVFVDALDGTREFVEGRLSNCQVLIGISLNGKAVAGAVGIPFPDGDLSSESTIVYGLVGAGTGVVGTPLRRGPYPLEHHIDGLRYPRPHHATGDSTAKVLEACRQGVVKRFGGSNVLYGGAGNKILAAALGEVACCIQHRVGGPWDLCASEAILKAMGGRMTDMFGEDIQMYRDDAPARCREWGYLASAPTGLGVGLTSSSTSSSSEVSEDVFHDALVATLLSLPEVQEYQKAVKE